MFNPEFLTEKSANFDFINQSRFVIGNSGKQISWAKSEDFVELIKDRFGDCVSILQTNYETAEFIKYMSNCFFATKVSFMNEMYQVCDAVGGDWGVAVDGFISDGRIGNSHIDVPGHDGDFGFGGKCFPKDINAMIKRVEELGITPSVMKAAWEKNKEVRKDLDWFDIPGAVSKNKEE